uniref:KWG Leptospira repeat protein n=1 Tax=Solibacter usitatus (strain Ellin6076) TaxID=234267 RepID=Q01VR2_SOLUE
MKLWWLGVLAISVAEPCSYDYTIWMVRSANADPYFRFVKNDKAGYIDRSGKVVIAPTLSTLGNFGEEFREGLLQVRDGFTEVNGQRHALPGFEMYGDFSEGLAAAQPEGPQRFNGKYGYIDRAGHWAIAARFDRAWEFSGGLARVELNGKTGFIGRTGSFIIPLEFSNATDFHEGRAAAILENCKIAGALCGGDHFAPEGDPEGPHCRYTVVDKTGRPISEGRYHAVRQFSQGLAAFREGDLWGYIDTSGRVVVTPRFEAAEPFSDGLAAVLQDKRWGFISRSGEFAIEERFAYAESFSEGLALVANSQGQFYIRKSGKPAFTGKFEAGSSFRFGLAHVLITRTKAPIGRFAYIDTKGRTVFAYAGTK